MKKLLALVLCVMMFVAIIPTAAFADWPDAWRSAKAISNAKANIEYLYGTLAADTTVFNTIKSVDSILTDMAKGMFDGTDKYDIDAGDGLGYYRLYNGDLVDSAKAILRSNIGEAITDYMDGHAGKYEKWTVAKVNGLPVYEYTDGAGNVTELHALTAAEAALAPATSAAWGPVYQGEDGWYYTQNLTTGKWAYNTGAAGSAWTNMNYTPEAVFENQIDPAKYVDTFATAVSKAFNSKDGAAAIQRIYYDLALAKLTVDMQDKFDDLEDDIEAWEGTDALLAAYGFNPAGNWNPYAFVNPDDLPKSIDGYTASVLEYDPVTTPYFLYD